MTAKTDHSLTIILTLKDRSPFTYRWMEYMNDIRCVYHILIADGGADTEIEDYLKDYKNYPNLNYTYIRYPFDEDLNTFYKKFSDVIDIVSTPYILFADNDDFFQLDSSGEFINFLDQNPDFVSCGGDYVSLSLLSDQNRAINATKASNYIAQSYKGFQSIDADLSADRIIYFLENVESRLLWYSWYNIHRTSAIKDCFEIFKEHKFNEVIAFEIHLHFFLLSRGKYKQINKTFYIRQEETSQSNSQLKIVQGIFERFIENNSFKEIQTSLNFSNPTLSEDDKNKIYAAFQSWLAEKKPGRHSAPTKGSMFDDFRKYLNETDSFRVFYGKKLLKQSKERFFKQDTRRYLRIPCIENHVIATDQSN